MRFFLIFIPFVVAGVIIGQLFYHADQDKVEPVVAEPNEAGFCFKEFLPYGEHMSWSETSKGRYDYEIYANTHGIEVWVPCK